ncbi:MAG: cytochrome c biogenesis protein CcdA [Beijerinckiaceae bacterium]|nr:cytochrome c biogenesis protein CcdA [Beijerinckiaceae bacterium]MCZ8301882.1 cytochrome c biogenesis protein CcdA [Beijerinckiaceae bacterium]
MTPELTLPVIFFAGLLSFLSPCVLPLVPPYLCYLAGTSVSELSRAGEIDRGLRRHALLAALFFVLGFSTVFIALGAGASLVGALLRAYAHILAQVAGVAIILMGLHFLGVFRLGIMAREARMEVEKPAGFLGAFVMGLAFAFGWTPCIGPVLAGVLAVAGSESSVARGAGLLAIYSAGLGVPFLLAAFMMGPFLRFLQKFRAHIGKVEKVMGVLLVLTGLAFLTGSFSQFGFYLLEAFPALGKLG